MFSVKEFPNVFDYGKTVPKQALGVLMFLGFLLFFGFCMEVLLDSPLYYCPVSIVI